MAKATKVTPMTFLSRIAAGNALILLGSSRQQLSLRIFNAEVAARRRQQEKKTNELYGEEERSSDHISFPPFVIVIGRGTQNLA